MLKGVYQKIPQYSTWGSSMKLRKRDVLRLTFIQYWQEKQTSMGMMKKIHTKAP